MVVIHTVRPNDVVVDVPVMEQLNAFFEESPVAQSECHEGEIQAMDIVFLQVCKDIGA